MLVMPFFCHKQFGKEAAFKTPVLTQFWIYHPKWLFWAWQNNMVSKLVNILCISFISFIPKLFYVCSIFSALL